MIGGFMGNNANSNDSKHFKTMIPGFDDLFQNGMPRSSSILVEGGPGSGKTVFCLQAGYNASLQGLNVLYMSFEEPAYRLEDHLKSFGFDCCDVKSDTRGIYRIKRFNAIDVAKSVEALLTEAKKELMIEVEPILIPADFNPDVVIIDSLSSIASAFSGEKYRFRVYMEQLFRYLEKNHIISFLINETPYPTHIGMIPNKNDEVVSFLSDGIISMYNVFYENGYRDRALEVVKMRGESIKRKIVKFEIKSNGIEVYPSINLTGDFHLT